MRLVDNNIIRNINIIVFFLIIKVLSAIKIKLMDNNSRYIDAVPASF